MKECTVCKTEKPYDSFHRAAKKKGGVQSRCKECAIRQNIARYHGDKERLLRYQANYDRQNAFKIKKRNLKKAYKLTDEEIEAILLIDRCEICGAYGDLHVDHCHTTNIVRGVLCMSCNTAIGSFRDNPVLLQRAIKYLS